MSQFATVHVNTRMSNKEIEKRLKPLQDMQDRAMIHPEKYRVPKDELSNVKRLDPDAKRFFYFDGKLIANYGFYMNTKEDITMLIESGDTLRVYKDGKSWLLIYFNNLPKQKKVRKSK